MLILLSFFCFCSVWFVVRSYPVHPGARNVSCCHMDSGRGEGRRAWLRLEGLVMFI